MAKVNRKKLESLMERYGLTREDVFLAVLISQGMPPGESFGVVYQSNLKDNDYAYSKYVATKPRITELVSDLKPVKRTTDDVRSGRAGRFNLRTKDGVLSALEFDAESTNDPKQRADIHMKIAELQRLKNEEDDRKNKLVHYYLPLRCTVCPWKNQPSK